MKWISCLLVFHLMSVYGQGVEIYEPRAPNLYVQVGKNFTLKCRDLDGQQVNWYKDSLELELTVSSGFFITSMIQNEDGQHRMYSTLHKESITPEDAGTYSCQRSQQHGTSYKVQVSVFDIIPEGAEYEPGADLVLQCEVKWLTSVGHMSWYHNGERIDMKDPSKYQSENMNKTLTITNAKPDDVGLYECRFNLSNNQTYSVQVYVNDTDGDISSSPLPTNPAWSIFGSCLALVLISALLQDLCHVV